MKLLKQVIISVSDFALPCPRKGSIESYSGLGAGRDSQARGMDIHQRYQLAQTQAAPDYKAEIAVKHSFPREEFNFEVGGRMDGFYANTKRIEEIKSSFNIYELLKRLREGENTGDQHPHILQLKTYGYFYWLQHGKLPQLTLHLISSRNGEALDMNVRLNVEDYEQWLALRLDELVLEARLAEKRSRRRKKSAEQLQFPFTNPRPGQIDLIESIETGIRQNRPQMIQAPTGLGKTIGVTYPLLKESLSRGQQLIYVTPKNSQHGVAEDAMERLQENGAKIKSMTFTAKSKMCLKNEPICNPDFCEYAKDHYTKIASNQLLEKLSKKKNLTAKVFKTMGREFEVCPFELQIDAAKEPDTIICDYNYVFAPRSALGRVTGIELEQEGKPNLAVDEAHNLVSRSLDYYSPELSSFALEKMRPDIAKLPDRFRTKTMRLLNDCISVITKAAPSGVRDATQINPPIQSFVEQDAELKEHLSNYLKSDVDIQARDPVMRMCFYWGEFVEALQYIALGRKEFFVTYRPNPASLKITCCDASEMLKMCYESYANVVHFSATLKPFNYYSQLSGLMDASVRTSEFTSPFPKEHRKLLLIPQISSKYSERERNYQKIADTIQKITALKPGNYFAFFPSFDFMNKVVQTFQPPPGFSVLTQSPHMSREVMQDMIDRLKEPGSAYVLFGVQGGVLSEGIDYPGDMSIGAFIIGPPLPNFNLEREKMREYYQDHYEAGFEYAYAYPAMAKAVQAAGRVIRGENDKGLIVLMDNRFGQSQFAGSMPSDWFDENPNEMVSQAILKDVAEFWENAGG